MDTPWVSLQGRFQRQLLGKQGGELHTALHGLRAGRAKVEENDR